ncbi:MAG: 4-phosphoerythronate dehydrogenase PdxB [Ignavibacteriaceae bacterium]
MINKVRIVADNKIPFLKGVLEPYADIQYLNPADITRDAVKDKDALIIRTRTHCNSELLDGTNVKFIATATIGFDHIDQEYCREKNIKWINAPGCNSYSVQQYIASVLLTLGYKRNLDLSGLTIGIVGVGNVGSKVERLAEVLGMKVLLNDPPRERNEGNEKFVTLDELVSKSDIITFHVPLIKDGIDKTFHMADENFFNKFNSSKIVFNTSRGQVIETNSIKNALKNKIVNAAVLDVWEHEPNIDLELLDMADIATPHIAGYSADGKANGTSVCVRNIASFFNLDIDKNWYPKELPDPQNSNEVTIDCTELSDQEIFYKAFISSYDILNDDSTLRNSVDTFEKQRGNYPVRREFPFYKIKTKNCRNEILKNLKDIGFQINT